RTSGLSLASGADMKQGGTQGPAIVPGKPDESLLIRMISGEKPKMPLASQPLSKEQVAEIRSWIEQGAPWPAQTGNEEWWSLQALRKPAVPDVQSDWVRTPIDAFILARLNEKHLTPS